MGQTVYLGKDIYFAIGDSPNASTVLSGIGNGLNSATYGDSAVIADKAGTGNYREKFDTERRAPTMTLSVQRGTKIDPALINQHGTLKRVEFGERGNASGDPKLTFDCYVVEPDWPFDAEADGISGDVTLMISGEPTRGTFS